MIKTKFLSQVLVRLPHSLAHFCKLLILLTAIGGLRTYGQDQPDEQDPFPDDLLVSDDSLDAYAARLELPNFAVPTSKITLSVSRSPNVPTPSDFKKYSDINSSKITFFSLHLEYYPSESMGFSVSTAQSRRYTGETRESVIVGYPHTIRHKLNYSPTIQAGLIYKIFRINGLGLISAAGIEPVKTTFKSELTSSPSFGSPNNRLVFLPSGSKAFSLGGYLSLGLEFYAFQWFSVLAGYNEKYIPGMTVKSETVIRRYTTQGKDFDYSWASYKSYKIATQYSGSLNFELRFHFW